MPNPIDPATPKPKKIFSKGKLILYGFALLGFTWLAIEAYWGYFKFKLWLSGFSTGAFCVVGLVASFVYFHLAHKIHEEIKAIPKGAKQVGSYGAFGLGMTLLNPVAVGLVVWLLTPPGSFHMIAQWFFVGALIGGGLVLGVERLFKKKKPKPLP